MQCGPKGLLQAIAAVCLFAACASDPSSSRESALLPLATSVDDLGPLPAELDAIAWPASPRVTRDVTVTDVESLTREAAVSGTRIHAEGVTGGDVQIMASDVELVADEATQLGRLTVGRGVERVRVDGGAYTAIRLDPPATWWPQRRTNKRWVIRDVWITNVTVDATENGVELRGERIVLAHSDVFASGYAVYAGDTPFGSEDVILYDDHLEASGPEEAVALSDVERGVVLASQLRSAAAAALGLHGESDGVYVADAVLVHGGASMNRWEDDAVGAVVFEYNALYAEARRAFDPSTSERVIAHHNVLFSDQDEAFYDGEVAAGWVLADNARRPYEAVPEGARKAGLRPGTEGYEPPGTIDPAPSPEPDPDPTTDPEPTPDPEPAPDPGPTTDPEPTPDPAPSPEPDPDPTTDPEPTPDPAPSPGGTGISSLGPLPAELGGLRWPEAPQITREVTARSMSELQAAVAVPGTRVRAIGVTGGGLTLSASDVELLADSGTRLGMVSTSHGVARVRVEGGHYAGFFMAIPSSFYPTREHHPEWMNEDVWFDGVTIDAPGIAFQIRGRRIAITHSDVTAALYSVWCGDTDPTQSEDVILFDNVFDSAGPESTVRLVSVRRSATVSNRMSNGNKHNYRIHGNSDLNYAADNIIVGGSGVMLGTMPGDSLGTVWFDNNALHLQGADCFNPSTTALRHLIARDNAAYSNNHTTFYAREVMSGWTMTGNTIQAYQPPPS